MSKEISKEKTNSLLNCPFCGGKAVLERDDLSDWFVRCKKCFCRTPKSISKFFLIKRWNTRIPMQNIVERLEDFREEALREVELDFATAYANAIRIVAEEGGIDEKVQ